MAEERRTLIAMVGSDYSLHALVKKMVGNEETWKVISFFNERVMLQKEETERARLDPVGTGAVISRQTSIGEDIAVG